MISFRFHLKTVQCKRGLKSMFDLFGFKQTVLKPTRITATSKTLIDIILTNTPLNLIATDVIPMGIGDHEMVGCMRNSNAANKRNTAYKRKRNEVNKAIQRAKSTEENNMSKL